MTRTLRIDDAAAQEIAAAVEWYDAQSHTSTLGSELLEQIDAAFSRIRDQPNAFPAIAATASASGARTCRLSRFPFKLVFIDLSTRFGFWPSRIIAGDRAIGVHA